MAERPLYTLYKNLKAQNYDVPDDYNKFESALTRDGKGGADNRHAIYENLKAQNFDVPNTYESFYSALFEPRSKTSSRAKGGSVPMSAADRASFSAGAATISASAQHTMNNAGRYNRLKQRKQKQQKDFGRVNLGTHQTPYGGDANNVVKDDFAYNPETGKAGAYVSSDNENVYSQPEAEQKQAVLDQQNNAYQEAIDTGEIPSVFDVRDKNGNYDLQENINKNGTYLTEEGAQKQFDKKLADAYARKKEIEALIAEDHRQHGNPLLSYGASIGASNGRTAEQSDYSNKLATSLALVKQQIGALEAVKQYPTSSWGEDAFKALDNTAFTAKTWDFGLADFATMGQMERIKTKMDNNLPLSGSDKMLLKSKLGADAAAALEDEKMGNIYRWTKIAGQSLPFMADFLLTGGYGGITKAISRGALKFAAKRGMGKVSAAILKNTGIVAGDVIGSYAMSGSEQALKTGADIMQRHLGSLYQDEKGDYKFGTFDENGNLLHEGGESMGTALYKGLTSAMVENYTEKLFGHSYGIKKGAINFMEKHGMNASAEFFKNIGKSGWYTNSKKWMEKFGINGFGEEVMEEEIGIPLHALLDGDNKFSDLLDTKQQLDIIGGMALSVGSMYAMGAGSRPVKGVYNRVQYYRFRNKVNVADSDAQNLMGDKWADIKDKIDNTTNEQMGGVLADILRQRDTMSKDQINAAINYGINLMKMRGYNVAKTAEMNAREITNEPTTPEEQHQEDIDNAYSEGHDADDADKHDIQLEHEDQMKTLAGLLNISEQQLSAMNDDELQSLTGQNDKLDQAIYDYQLSSARYQGVTDDAQDKIDMAANQAAQRVDMYTDKSRGSVRNATVKASGGAEDYGVYIISGNIATNEDGSINVADSDDMILFYDPTTNSVEHADALRFAELGDEVPADDVKAQAVADAKENAIKEVAGIVDGTIDVGSQFKVTGADGLEHTYEILADYGDGTAAISIDGNVVENPYSLEDLQQLKDLEDQKRLEAAKAEREQMEKERAAQQTQETEQPEETQPSLDFNQILNDNGNVVLVDVLDKDGNTKYPDSKLFLIRDTGAKAKVVEMKSDGTFVPHAVSKKNVATISSMSLDEYKQAMAETSMIEENSGAIEGDRGGIEVNDELPPVPDNVTINGDGTYSVDGAVQGGENNAAPAEQIEQTPAMTLEDGTIVPMLEDGNPDFSKLTAEQTAELYDSQFGEDADSVISGWVSDAKKALDKANNMTVKGKNFVEQKAAKEAKEKAIADAQAAYDSAIAIRDAYNNRQLAKVEDDADGRKNLIEKARRKYNRLKSAVKDDAEAVSQLYKDVVGSLLHRLYDGTGIDVTDTIPLTAEEYVASNLGAHSLNYEGTETSKGVKQETGLSRDDFAKTQLLAADGKGTTIDDLVHSLWENRPSNLESLNTQDIRNALIDVITSSFKASEARNYVENLRIAQAENFLEEQKKAADNAAFAEENKAEAEQQTETAPESEEKTEEENSDEINDEENEKINEQTNENINIPEVPEDATAENPLGAQLDQTDLPFSARDNGTQQTTAERAADVEKNKVDDIKVVDNIVGQKTRKAFERLAKMMGADIQWLYSDKLGNGWIQETKDADGNVHRTIFITLDSSITEGAQFIFGHEMTHQIKNLNPAAYNELTQLVLDTYGSDAFDKAVDETMKRYSDAGFSGRDREYYAEEVVADAVGEMIRDLNLAHTLAMKMSHPLLAAIHEILQKIKLAFFGTEYSDVTKNIIRSIEQAYVKTGGKEGEIFNGHRFSLKVYHGSGADFTEFDFDHMGEGAGSQAFGWGGYVTSSKKIGKNYATLMDNDPSKAYYRIQRSNGTRFAKKYPTLESFLHGDKQIAMNDKFTEQEKIDFYNEMKKLAEPYHNLYEVNIPDDNGSNYLDWDAPITDELIDKVAKALPSLRSYDIKDLKKDRTFGNLYKTISMRNVKDDASFNDDKAASKLLSSLGYTGIKYKAGRNFGGAEEGDTNYVIFKPEDMRITEHTKFSLKNIKPVGKNKFGDVYDQFKGKPKEAFDFLLKNKDGYLKGVFHRDEIGDIDLGYGEAPTPYTGYGLAHIIRKHVELMNDFDSVDDAVNAIIDVISNGKVEPINKDRVYEINKDIYRVAIAKDENGNWVLSAMDKSRSKKQKLRDKSKKGAATVVPPSLPSDGAGAVAPNLSAAKIDNSSEISKENGEKFSLKDEKTMFGMHNISIDKLRKAIKQGGFAAPSMGVVDSKNGIYSDYGEITLIPKAEKLAKRTGKNAGTFTADAWTPTYPQVERIMNKQGEKTFNTDMNEKLGDVDNGIYSNIRESWKGYFSSGDVRDGLYWHYLFDKGMNPETIYQTGKYDNDITNEVMRISDNGNKTDYTDEEVAELIQLKNKATGEDNDVEAMREKLKARIASAEKKGNHLLAALKKKRLAELEGVENFYIAADFVNDVVRNNRKNGKVDVHDTMSVAKEKVENDKKLSVDFPSWLDKKTEEYGVEEMLYNGTTPSGKPKYIPNTIDNAVKLMKKQGVAGGYTAFGSELGVFIAKNSPEVNTLAAMKNAKDKLIPFGDERHNQIKDKISKEFLELSDEIRVGSNNRYAFDDSGVSRMVELTDHKGNEKEYLKKAYNVEVSDEWMDRYNKLLDTIKKDYKVFYFETKFMRPYGLDEFEKAIVPSDTPSDVVDALKKAGIDVSSYERGNAEDRQKVTMDAINSSDNIRFSLAGERGAAAADKAEERTARMDNLSVARKMEEEKKDAKAIKMATGWERGADGKWRYEMPDAKIKDTMDVGGGHIVKRYEDDMLWNGGKLSDVIDAPELFKAYPHLKDVRIETDAIMNDMPSNGEYNAKTNTITIHADELKYMNSILNHEIQHAIQSIEGFDRGGSPRLVRGEIKKRLAEVTKQIRQLRAEGKEDEAKAIVEKNRGLYNAYQANDDYNSYKSLAGEVEARNVQERMNMTPEERRKSLAESTEDVARKDQIFLGVGDVSYSLRDMADGKESGAADIAEDLKSLNTPDEVDDAIKTAIEDMPSGWKMANKKMIHIAQALGENRKAEIAGEEPKFSLKDGTLIKAGTYFSGGGLVEEGLKGIIDPVVAVEYDEKISGVYRNNFGQHIVTADVRDVDPKELVKQIDGEVEYFHASPVCKNYSQAKSNHAEVELDKETAASTAEFINAVKPKVVTIENVKGYKDSEAMKTITDALDANGYTWDADVYNAADYGGYTNRERLIVRAVRDGKLPTKPKKMAHKSGWYEAVEDIIPTLTEKKNGVAPWMDIRLKADGIDWRNIDKPLYVMGSAYADGKIPHAFADELLPTLRTKSGDVIVMPDGKVYRAMGRVLARVSGVSDDYKMPFSENLSHTIIGNGIPTQLTEHVIAPLLTGSDPKFSIRTYHGTGASFDKFDLSHALEGEGSESFGHGVYVTNSSKIGREYAQRAKQRKMEDLYKNMRYPDGVKGDIFKRRVFGEMVNDVATGGSVASAKEFAKKRIGADANDIQRTLENLKDREKGTEYEQNLKDRLAEYKEGLKWIDSLDEDYLTQGNANRYDVDIPDDNGSNYLDWEGIIPDSLDKQKVAEDAYKVVSDNRGFNDFKATPLNDFIAHTLKTYVNTTDVAGRVEKLKSDIKDVIENYVADDDVLALNEYLKDATPDDVLATIWYNDLVRDIKDADLGEDLYRELSTYVGDNAASQILSDNGLVGIKYPAGMIHGGAKEGDTNYVIFDENNANIVGNTRFSLRYDQFEHDLNQWKKDNNLPKDAQRPTIPQRNAGESAVDFLRRVDEYRKQMALWKTAPTYEQHLLSDDTALGEFNRELQRGSVLKRIAFQDSMLAIRKAQEAIMKEVGVDRLNMAEDAYTAENRSHGKGKNEFEEYNNEFLQPLRKAYHQMKKVLGDSYDNVRVYMMAKHGLERDAQMAFKKSLEADYEDVNQRSAAYKAYKNDLDRVSNDADLEFGRVDFTTWRQKDNALRGKYSPSYMDYRYDENGIVNDYSGLSQLFGGSDFEEAAHKLVRDVETKHLAEVQALWNATNAATKKILRDGFKAGMMSKEAYEYVKGMYSHYIPLRGWDGTTADQVWDYIGGGKGAFNQTLKTAHGRTSIADDPIAYIENMAESGILLNNKNWVKQHLMLLAQNHPTSLLTLSKAWYVKSTDANGNEEWIPATPQITSQMNSNQVKAAIDAFEKKMEQTGDATQMRDGLNIAYPQTHSEEREHEVRVMKDGEEYVIYVNGDPQLAQAMNNTRAHRVREIQSGKLDRAAAWLGRKMAAAYTSLSPLFIPSNYFRDLTMTLASTAIREDGRYNYLLRKNLATSWNLGFMLRDYQNGKLREKVSNGNATPKEQMFYDFMMNGGETGFVSSLDVEDLKKKFKNDLKDLDRWKANPVKVGHTIMDGIEFLNRAIEDSNRFAIYMTSIQYGRSIDEAVNDAKNVTLNFNRKGTGEYGWQMIRNLYLFINPAVQSLQTLGALAKHHPFKFTAVTASWLASGVLVPIVNAALMSLLGGDDDKDKYWQFSKWDRRNNAIMWIPFTNEYVKIPLAQEFRAFYGIGDMIASKMMGGELAEETWSQYAEDMLGQVVDMLPLDPTGYDGNIAVSLMPNAIRPVFELAFNVDFTGKPLFKDSEYNKYDPNFTKAYVGTPDWLVRVSKMVNSIGNDYPDVQQNAIDAFGDPRYNLNNPAVVDHVLSSYLGGAYTMGSQVLGVLTKSLNDPKEIKMADIPLVSKFVSNPDDRPVTKKQGDEFWNMKENHDRAANTLSKLKKQAKVDGDYTLLEQFYGSEEYKQYKQDDVKVKKYEEDKKKERAEESGEEYRPHKLNAEDIYKAHATPQDDFEDLKLKQLFTKLNGFKTSYDLLVDTAPSQSEGYYNTNKAAIDAIDEISLDKQEISELKKGFLDDGKDAYNAEDMKRIRELRKRILSVLELANKMVVANQKAKAEKK